MLDRILRTAKLLVAKRSWRSKNGHNETELGNLFASHKVRVGRRSYGVLNVIDHGNGSERLTVGSYCSIAPDVVFLLSGEHQINSISTYPFNVKRFGALKEAGSKGNIMVGDDVWIGTRAIICSGVSIGQGAVVGAGSVVTRDVEPYGIVAGSPARVIGYRFEEDLREQLVTLDVPRVFDGFQSDDAELVYSPLDQYVLDKLLKGRAR